MVENDRRKFQRMKLVKPILAQADGASALILDIGMGGAFIEHYGITMPGAKLTVSFRWQGEEISFICVVVRTSVISSDDKTTVSQTGVTFARAVGSSTARLQDMMATFVGRVLAAQKANAAAGRDTDSTLPQLGAARRSRSKGYIAYLWDGESWTCRPTRIADQPRTGFTVAAYEDEDELETLCRAYEAADEEGRNLIRLVAELSASSVQK